MSEFHRHNPNFEPQPREELEVIFNLVDDYFDQALRIQSQITTFAIEKGKESAGRGAYLATDSISFEDIGLKTVTKRILLDYPYHSSKGRYGEVRDLDTTTYPPVLEKISSRPLHIFKPEISDLFEDNQAPKIYIASFASPRDEDGRNDIYFLLDRERGIEHIPSSEQVRAELVAQQTSRIIFEATNGTYDYNDVDASQTSSAVSAEASTEELMLRLDQTVDKHTLHTFWINNLKHRQLTPITH